MFPGDENAVSLLDEQALFLFCSLVFVRETEVLLFLSPSFMSCHLEKRRKK